MSNKNTPEMFIKFSSLPGKVVLWIAEMNNFALEQGALSQQKILKHGNSFSVSGITPYGKLSTITFQCLGPKFSSADRRKIKQLEQALKNHGKELKDQLTQPTQHRKRSR